MKAARPAQRTRATHRSFLPRVLGVPMEAVIIINFFNIKRHSKMFSNLQKIRGLSTISILDKLIIFLIKLLPLEKLFFMN